MPAHREPQYAFGLRPLRRQALQTRLRASGVRGKATVVSYAEAPFVVGRYAPRSMFRLQLRVEVPGRPPWEVSRVETVRNSGRIYTNAILPVLVDPAKPSDLVIDWD
jgi:hypothetical protein